MCGFAGVFGRLPFSGVESHLQRMGDSLQHRGPDDSGVWVDADEGVGFVHRRLSIMDLSSLGHQPMHSVSGRYVIVFNGEIYNYRMLQSELEKEGFLFKGHSDTEVLLSAFDVWGIEVTLQKANGMFSLALWDNQLKRLILARDRLGEKPLYYGWQGKSFLFGSELKALMCWPSFKKVIDKSALALFLRLGYVPGEYSIFQGVRKLPAGNFLVVDQKGNCSQTCYWSAAKCTEEGVSSRFEGNEDEAIQSLDALLRDAVSLRMEADVPLGGFLSGGIDSSLVVAIMQATSHQPIKTFTVGFYDPLLNEADQAKAVAGYLGTEHTEIYLDPKEALNVIPGLPDLFDEPFADESQIPTYMVAKVARKYVTVALSGDGGDEIFAGYNRHISGRKIWNRVKKIPYSVRSGVGYLGKHISNPLVARIASVALSNSRITSEHMEKLFRVISSKDPDDVYFNLISTWCEPPLVHELIQETRDLEKSYRNELHHPFMRDVSETMMSADLRKYLPDDILVKLDRSLMGVSLEGRIPLLDHRVVEFGWKLPLEYKLREGQGKWILRQLLYKYIPKSLVDRPKMGFNVPLAEWLRGPLKDWAESLLDENLMKDQGLLDARAIQKVWRLHQSGLWNYSHELWNVLMFQAWYKRWMMAG